MVQCVTILTAAEVTSDLYILKLECAGGTQQFASTCHLFGRLDSKVVLIAAFRIVVLDTKAWNGWILMGFHTQQVEG